MALKIGQISENPTLPPTNRGVLNTESGLDLGTVTLDWVSATFPYSDAIWGRLVGTFGNVSRRQSGALGYPNALTVLGSGLLLWNDQRPEMGLHLILPAQALALWQFAPVWLLEIIINNDGKFTRIDLALDDEEKQLSLETIVEKLENGEVQTRFHGFKVHLPETAIGEKIGQISGISIGSRQSQSFIRIYDKRQERAKKGITDLPDHWIRIELETKGDRADALGKKLQHEMRHTPQVTFVASLVLGLIDFKEPSTIDTNKSRWQTANWWSEFLGTVSKIRITLPKFERTLEQVKDWFSNHIAVMACVVLLNTMQDGQSGYDWLMEAIAAGEERFKNKHKKLIEGYE